MRIEVLSISRGYYNYGCDNANRAENVNSPAFKSWLYNPKSIIHKTNPVLQFIDDFFSRSVVASRRTWHKPIKEIQPHLQVIDIKDKKHPHVRMWDINDAEKTKITIRVNNVMTYYRNGLLDRKLSNILIYDLFDAVDRQSTTTVYSSNTNMSVNQTKGQFLKKHILLEKRI